jgi:hypothetical protein
VNPCVVSARKLDTQRRPAHDFFPVEQPSLLESLIRLPGALVRLPSSAVTALDAINDMSERLDRLMVMMEHIENGMNRAGSGIDLATSGISGAMSGLGNAVGILDSSFPSLSDSASALRNLTERLAAVAVELTSEVPKPTRSLQEVSPEPSTVVGPMDELFTHLDAVVTELARLMEDVVGMIPGMRRLLRPPTPI